MFVDNFFVLDTKTALAPFGTKAVIYNDLLFLAVLLHLHYYPRSKAEGVFEDGCFGKAYVLVPAVVELFEDLFLLVGEGFLQVLVMPCHVSE